MTGVLKELKNLLIIICGSPGQKKLLIESGNVAFDETIVRTPEPGQDVQLTVDAGIQSIVQKH